MEEYGLPDKEFKISLMNMFNKLRKMMHEQSENIYKELENLKKNNLNFKAEVHKNWTEKFATEAPQ